MLKNSMKTKNILTTSLIILFFLLGITLLLGIVMGIPYIVNNIGNMTNIVAGVGLFILGSIYFIMIILILEIVSSSKVNIFVKANVKRFRQIGYLLLLNLIIDYISMLFNGVTGMRFLDVAPGVFITPSMSIYFISGLLCFVIADAFDQAIKIKEDNDLTI
ncbi:DUF2975 domain-containing protein [Terrisporobacter sp.]|uniref:DUF2975 domain-containing protein n=1 Tax=Terrisporobacter sp. TaxID=1965305 RepID=UPI002627DC6A|nr:DUF2975 domain-containing protein [Terrisporobacter sp.]